MRPTAQPSWSEQEYPYGWRYVQRTAADGTVQIDQVPLTLEDVLHPREGDVIPESMLQLIRIGVHLGKLSARDAKRLVERVAVGTLNHEAALHPGGVRKLEDLLRIAAGHPRCGA